MMYVIIGMHKVGGLTRTNKRFLQNIALQATINAGFSKV